MFKKVVKSFGVAFFVLFAMLINKLILLMFCFLSNGSYISYEQVNELK